MNGISHAHTHAACNVNVQRLIKFYLAYSLRTNYSRGCDRDRDHLFSTHEDLIDASGAMVQLWSDSDRGLLLTGLGIHSRLLHDALCLHRVSLLDIRQHHVCKLVERHHVGIARPPHSRRVSRHYAHAQSLRPRVPQNSQRPFRRLLRVCQRVKHALPSSKRFTLFVKFPRALFRSRLRRERIQSPRGRRRGSRRRRRRGRRRKQSPALSNCIKRPRPRSRWNRARVWRQRENGIKLWRIKVQPSVSHARRRRFPLRRHCRRVVSVLFEIVCP